MQIRQRSKGPYGRIFKARKEAEVTVFVLDQRKRPLMPCTSYRADKLLKSGRARVHKRYPFTIRITDRKVEKSVLQPVAIKLDPGSKKTGVAVVRRFGDSEETVLWLAELAHRGKQISEALTQRASFRRRRRGANLRYRPARFDNRTKPKGWLAPSLRHRVETTASWVARLRRFVPVASISVELVRFDMQAMENSEISGVEYQRGTLFGTEIREYLLAKWNRQCAYCDATGVPLNIDHVIPRARGGSDRVSNLCCACIPCNEKKGAMRIEDFLAKKPAVLKRILAHVRAPLKDAAAVNSTRLALVAALQMTGLPVATWSGGRTKWNRTRLDIPKSHALDAACVGNVEILNNWRIPTLEIKCTGRGAYQRTRPDKFGFPRGYLMREKSVFGFSTGDHVIATVASGKGKGRHVGRVAVRKRGWFVVQTTTGKSPDVIYKNCKIVQRGDGYGFAVHAISNSFRD